MQKVFPFTTGIKPFGTAQLDAIRRIQHNILHGGRLAQAFPRGYAKTSISTRAALWALCYGHRRYVPIFCLNEPAAQNIVDAAKQELCENQILLGMFPWLQCFHALEGKPQRCSSQHVDGSLTHIGWRADRVIFPTGKGCTFSGSVFQAKSKDAARGLFYTNADGETIRPDFIMIDDIQDDDDALSQPTVLKIVSKVKKGALRGGGHSKTIAAVMNCTCIQPRDVAETFLNDKGWHGIRYRMVERMPDRMDLWEGPYKELLLDYDRKSKDPSLATQAALSALEFYKQNREEMDAGSECSWEWAFAWDDEPQTEISAIQHAMNIMFVDGKEVFQAECQNDPIRVTDGLQLTPEGVMAKAVDVAGVPQEATHVVAAIDVQQDCLPYAVAGIGQDYTGGIAEYGVYPEQEAYYNAGDPKRTLRAAQGTHDATVESGIYFGLVNLVDSLLKKKWMREDGLQMQLELVLVDASFKTETVELFCRTYTKVRCIPARGKFIGARHTPIDEKKYEQKPGEARGCHWELRKTADGAGLQLSTDINYWKSFVWSRYATPHGAPSSWRIMRMERQRLQLFADGVCAEFPTRVEAAGRVVDEWQDVPGMRRNESLDISVILAVGANYLGCQLPNADLGKKELKRIRRRVKFGE